MSKKTNTQRPGRATLAADHKLLIQQLSDPNRPLDVVHGLAVETNAQASSAMRNIRLTLKSDAEKQFASALIAHSFGSVMGRIQGCIYTATHERRRREQRCVENDNPAQQKAQADAVAGEIQDEFENEWLPDQSVTGNEVNKTFVGQLTGIVMGRLK